MQTYTHLFIGGVIAGAVTTNPWVQAACLVGAVSPDLVFVPFLLAAKLKSKSTTGSTWDNQPRSVVQAKEISHSIVIWWILTLLALWIPGLGGKIALAFLGNYSLHLLIDIFTHSGKDKFISDQGCAWPFGIKLGHYLCVWEYRKNHGIKCQWPELVLNLVLMIWAVPVMWKVMLFSLSWISPFS